MTAIPDETTDLLETLLYTIRVIVESGAQDRQRITNTYRDAQALVTEMTAGGSEARPRIEACLERFNAFNGLDDIAAAGWMLTAIQQRVAERNLYGWRKLQEIVDVAVDELLLSEQMTVH